MTHSHRDKFPGRLPSSRRQWLAGVAAAAAAGATTPRRSPAQAPREAGDTAGGAGTRVKYCLNTSTVRGQKLTAPEQIDLAAKAGYDAVEPWMRDLTQYRDGGGSLRDLRKRIEDAGLTVESAIGFARWIVDDPQQRAAALEDAKRDMDLLAQIGGLRIAAPPVGATNEPGLDLSAAAQRYAALLEVGRRTGVVPQLELWGFSQNLSRLGELMYVAVESGHQDACVLPDVYHIYKGGSDFAGLRLIEASRIHVFHMNDYPSLPPRAEIKDADRVYPGQGVAPLSGILATLFQGGFRGALSLELFNPDYWEQDALLVARTGLEAMKEAVAKADV